MEWRRMRRPKAQELKIRQVACDSRKVQAGSLLFALHGAKAERECVCARGGGARRRGNCREEGPRPISRPRWRGFACARRARHSR